MPAQTILHTSTVWQRTKLVIILLVSKDVVLVPMQLKEQAHLTWECQNELFRQEVEGADDIRLNAPLISKCMGDKKMFCDDIAPGRNPDKASSHAADVQSQKVK